MKEKIILVVGGIILLVVGFFTATVINKKPDIDEKKSDVVATVTPEVKEIVVTQTVTVAPSVVPTNTPTMTPTVAPTIKPIISIIKINPSIFKIFPTATPHSIKIIIPSIKINLPKW